MSEIKVFTAKSTHLPLAWQVPGGGRKDFYPHLGGAGVKFFALFAAFAVQITFYLPLI